MMYNKKKGK